MRTQNIQFAFFWLLCAFAPVFFLHNSAEFFISVFSLAHTQNQTEMRKNTVAPFNTRLDTAQHVLFTVECKIHCVLNEEGGLVIMYVCIGNQQQQQHQPKNMNRRLQERKNGSKFLFESSIFIIGIFLFSGNRMEIHIIPILIFIFIRFDADQYHAQRDGMVSVVCLNMPICPSLHLVHARTPTTHMRTMAHTADIIKTNIHTVLHRASDKRHEYMKMANSTE